MIPGEAAIAEKKPKVVFGKYISWDSAEEEIEWSGEVAGEATDWPEYPD